MAERNYHWFVHPHDSHTNKVISQLLDESELATRDTTDGKMELWECPHVIITKLKNSARDLHLSFAVYVQEGNGQIRPFSVPQPVRTKTAA